MSINDLELAFPKLPDAACRDIDPERFFPFEDRQVDQARQICRRCPEIRACLAWALTHTEWGIWAATTPEERRHLNQRHRSPA